jgi:glyoxylase-like metal-dependent hydrolase (beta-lactamase superfamily II)
MSETRGSDTGIAAPAAVRHDAPVRLGARVWRLTASNAGMMTGPGTNSYLVGAGDGSAVIDPGPADGRHIAALIAAAPGPIREILVTHTHEDHSPGAAALKSLTGASVLGLTTRHPHWQDPTFAADRELHHGERIGVAAGATLRVVHTPGHASNHLCYLLEEERLLFTGDHIIQGSTVVIDPPDGDMAAYLRSLKSLLEEDLAALAPGHGTLIPAPRAAIESLIRHRERRESKVLASLSRDHPAGLAALIERVYDDVPAHLHGIAERSLLAHLLKLEYESRARRAAQGWLAAP